MTTKTTTTKGICTGDCGKPQRISKDGTLASHKRYSGRYSPRCSGSWRAPASLVEIAPVVKNSKPRDWCGACLKDVAIDSGDYSHNHGYKRPGWGYNVGGCPGRGHKVLGISSSAIVAERDSSADGAAYWAEQEAKRAALTPEEFKAWREEKAEADKRNAWRLPRMQSDWVEEATRNHGYALEAAYLADARLTAWELGTDSKTQMVAYEAARVYWRELKHAEYAILRAKRGY